MWSSVPTLAGTVATLVFASSVLPMLVKALRSKDLASYSSGNLVLAECTPMSCTPTPCANPPTPAAARMGRSTDAGPARRP